MRFAILFTLCLLGVASAHSLNKRFINGETIKQHAAELKAKLDSLKDSLMSHFHHKPAAVEASAEVALEKRDIHEIFEKMSKFAQTKTQAAKDQLRKILDKIFKPFNDDAEDTTEHPLAKRGLFDALERMNTKAQASAQKVFDRLQKTISSIFAPFKKPATRPVEEDSTEKPVAKRSIFDRLERMNEKVQAQAQKAFNQLRKVFDELFKKHPDAHGIEVEIQDGEVVTERIIKRDIFDFFGRLNEKLQDQAAKIFGNLGDKFGNIIRDDDDEDEEDLDLDFDDDEEDSTEVSIEKRDIFNWLGDINERFQDKASKFFHQMPKPHLPHHGFNMPNPFAPKPHPPKPAPKPAPKPEDEVEEIEVVTSA